MRFGAVSQQIFAEPGSQLQDPPRAKGGKGFEDMPAACAARNWMGTGGVCLRNVCQETWSQLLGWRLKFRQLFDMISQTNANSAIMLDTILREIGFGLGE